MQWLLSTQRDVKDSLISIEKRMPCIKQLLNAIVICCVMGMYMPSCVASYRSCTQVYRQL